MKKKEDADILSDKSGLLLIYIEVNKNARYVVDKIWTNARFFTTIISGMLTATGAGIVAMLRVEPINFGELIARNLLIIIPGMVIVIAIIGVRNLAREYSRFLEWVVVLNKLQYKLGLYKEMEWQQYTTDKYLLPKQFIAKSHSSSEEFVQAGLKKKGSLYYYFKLLNGTYISIAIILIIVILWFNLKPLFFE